MGSWHMDRSPKSKYSSTPIPASSVPYFGPTCGDRFVTVDQFGAAFKSILGEPRRGV